MPLRKLGRRFTTHFALIEICFNLSYCCVLNFSSLYLLGRGLTNSEVGIVMTLASAVSLVIQPALSATIDKYEKITPRRAILAILVGAMALYAVLIALPQNAPGPVFAVIYVVLGSLVLTQFPLLTTLSMEALGLGIPLNYSVARGCASLTYSGAAYAMGVLAQDLGAWIVIPVALGISAAQFAFAAAYRYPSSVKPAEENKTSKPSATALKSSGFFAFLARNKRYTVVLLGSVFVYYSHSLINAYLLQIVRHVGGDASSMGFSGSLSALLEVPAMFLFPLVLRRVGSAGLLLKFSMAAFCVKCVFTFFAPNLTMVYVASALQFFAFAVYTPASVYYVQQAIPASDMAKGQSSSGMVSTVGTLLGHLSGGFMLDWWGVPAMLAVGSVVSAVGTAIVFAAVGKTTKKMSA